MNRRLDGSGASRYSCPRLDEYVETKSVPEEGNSFKKVLEIFSLVEQIAAAHIDPLNFFQDMGYDVAHVTRGRKQACEVRIVAVCVKVEAANPDDQIRFRSRKRRKFIDRYAELRIPFARIVSLVANK